MATKNDITGDIIQTKSASELYRDNYDRIFKKDKVVMEIVPVVFEKEDFEIDD